MARPQLRGPSRAAPATPAAPGDRRGSEHGQMLVIFALALVALIGMVGLIIDGGDTFLQRREQQNVADAAAMAAGYASVNGLSADAAAQAVAAANGYTNGQDGTVVTVNLGAGTITVDVTRPHRNYFSGVMGFASWGVSTTATVETGIPNGAYGAMPLIFNQKAWGNEDRNRDRNNPASFVEPGTGNQDVPQTDGSFNWTVFCTANGNPCNSNAETVRGLMESDGTTTTIYTDDDIGPLNSGATVTLFSTLAGKVGTAFPVAIVDDEGKLKSWAWFHLTGSVGGETKQISGWFEDQANKPPFKIDQDHDEAEASGVTIVKLID